MAKKVGDCNISFIIPCYNPRLEDLKTAILSILKQIDRGDRIVVVDDGSDDSSGILETCKIDNRIKYLRNKTNAGVSFSRNRAMKECSTKWLTFVDADDEVLPDSIKAIKDELKKNKNIDVLVCSVGWQKRNEYYEFPLMDEDEELKFLKVDLISSVGKHPRSIGIAVGKIYNSDFLKQNGVLFSNHVTRSEDNIFFLDVLMSKPVIKIAPVVMYLIKDNPYSTTHKYTENVWYAFSNTLKEFEKHMEKSRTYEEALSIRRGKYVYMASVNEFNSDNYRTLKEKKAIVKEILSIEQNRNALKAFYNTRGSFIKRAMIRCLVKQRLNTAALLFSLRNKVVA